MSDIDKLRMNTDKAKRFFEKKLAFTAGPVELKQMIEDGEDIVIVDVRKKEDYENGHIKQAISIPKKELLDNLNKLSRDKVTVVYCYTMECHLAARAAFILASEGYPVMELEGGIEAWRDHYKFEVASFSIQ
ncbi:MAG: rhodanese-like domain-containing protein [bacterium]